MKHLNALQDAAKLTPELSLAPLDAIMHNRIEAYMQAADLDVEVYGHLQAVYLMAMQDASTRLCQLFEESA